MGWLLPRNGQPKEEDGSRKRGRVDYNGGASSGSTGGIDPLQATLLMHNSRLQLNLAQRTRMLEGVNFEVLTAPTAHPFVTACVQAGQDYSKAVKGNKNHGHGPPHPHIWHAAINYLSNAMDCEAQGEMQQYFKDLNEAEPLDILSSIRACKVKKCHDETKTNLSFCIIEGQNDALPHAHAMDIVRDYLVKVAGAERRLGPPPATGLERDVQKLHDRFAAHLEQRGVPLPEVGRTE